MKTFPLVFILLICLGFLCCKKNTQESNPQNETTISKLPVIHSAINDSNSPVTVLDTATLPAQPVPAVPQKRTDPASPTLKKKNSDRMFNEYYRPQLDSVKKANLEWFRSTDSLRKAKRREYYIEDSLERLK
jgi:hypothetical protein